MILEFKVFNEIFFKGEKHNMVWGDGQIKVWEKIAGNKEANWSWVMYEITGPQN